MYICCLVSSRVRNFREREKKIEVHPKSAALFPSPLSGEAGFSRKSIAKQSNKADLSCKLKRMQRPFGNCCFSATVLGFSELIFREQRLSTELQGYREEERQPVLCCEVPSSRKPWAHCTACALPSPRDYSLSHLLRVRSHEAGCDLCVSLQQRQSL